MQLQHSCTAARQLLLLSQVINQMVGDALSGILAVEATLRWVVGSGHVCTRVPCVHMCVCVCVLGVGTCARYVFVCVCVYVYTCTLACEGVYMCVPCVPACVHAAYACAHVCVRVHVCTHMCARIVYVCVCACVCVSSVHACCECLNACVCVCKCMCMCVCIQMEWCVLETCGSLCSESDCAFGGVTTS
jgi:hypothetical protein